MKWHQNTNTRYYLWYAHISSECLYVHYGVMNDRHMDHSIPAHWMAIREKKMKKKIKRANKCTIRTPSAYFTRTNKLYI